MKAVDKYTNQAIRNLILNKTLGKKKTKSSKGYELKWLINR